MATKRAKKPRASPVEEASPERRALHYKVVELSSVDEHTLERTINEWVPMGWKFDGLQFAMRESSKRPSMAFVFFTREGGRSEPFSRGLTLSNPYQAHRAVEQARPRPGYPRGEVRVAHGHPDIHVPG